MTRRKAHPRDAGRAAPEADPAPLPVEVAQPAAEDAAGEAVSTEAAVEQAPAAVSGAVADLEARLAEQQDKYLRLFAEYENYRKRASRERQEAEVRGMGVLIRGLLDALDDLGRFAHLDPAATDTKTVVDGAGLVERKVLKSLAAHGLEVVSPLGQSFDPAFHEALTTMPASSPEEDHMVGQVYQVGYMFNGQLLRAARVVVKQWTAPAAATEPLES